MTTTRLNKNKKLNNIKAFIVQAEQVINEISPIFNDFFSQNDHQSKINETLFEHLLIKMNVQDVAFSSLAELDLYYNDLIKNLDLFIERFYRANPEQEINEKINKASFAPVISLYHTLAKYNFILNKLNDSYHDFKNKIKIENIAILNINSSIDFQQLEKYYNEIEVFTLHLSSLLTSTQVNSAIDGLKRSVQKNDKENIEKYTNLLRRYQEEIKEAKNQLPNFYQYNNFLEKIALQRNLFKNQIDDFNKALQFFQVLKLMVEWLNKKEIKKAFDAVTDTHHLSFDMSILELLSTKQAEHQKKNKLMETYKHLFLDKCHVGLTRKHNQFSTYIQSYLQPFVELCTRFEEIDRNHFMLHSKLQNVRQLWSESTEVVETIENNLNEQSALIQKDIPKHDASIFGDLSKMLFDVASSTFSFWQQVPPITKGKEENVAFKKNGYN